MWGSRARVEMGIAKIFCGVSSHYVTSSAYMQAKSFSVFVICLKLRFALVGSMHVESQASQLMKKHKTIIWLTHPQGAITTTTKTATWKILQTLAGFDAIFDRDLWLILMVFLFCTSLNSGVSGNGKLLRRWNEYSTTCRWS